MTSTYSCLIRAPVRDYEFDPNAAWGEAVDPASIMLDGTVLDPDGEYVVATNSAAVPWFSPVQPQHPAYGGASIGRRWVCHPSRG